MRLPHEPIFPSPDPGSDYLPDIITLQLDTALASEDLQLDSLPFKLGSIQQEDAGRPQVRHSTRQCLLREANSASGASGMERGTSGVLLGGLPSVLFPLVLQRMMLDLRLRPVRGLHSAGKWICAKVSRKFQRHQNPKGFLEAASGQPTTTGDPHDSRVSAAGCAQR